MTLMNLLWIMFTHAVMAEVTTETQWQPAYAAIRKKEVVIGETL